MTVSFNIGWWLLPITVMWVWLAAMFLFGRFTSTDVADFFVPFVLVTLMCMLTRFLP